MPLPFWIVKGYREWEPRGSSPVVLQKHLVEELQVRQCTDFSSVFAVYRLLCSMVHDQLSTHPHGIDFDIELFMPYHLQPLPPVCVFLSTSFILVSCKTQKRFPSFSHAHLRGACTVCSQRLLQMVATFCFFITSMLLFAPSDLQQLGFLLPSFFCWKISKTYKRYHKILKMKYEIY